MSPTPLLHHLVDLTDEELVALVGVEPWMALPHLTRLDDRDRTTATAAALRSLATRGLVSRVDIVTDGGDRRARAVMDGDLATVLDVRTLGHTLAVRRTVAAVAAQACDYSYVYAAGGTVLLEDVGSEGVHAFSIGPADALANALQQRLVSPGATSGVATLVAGRSIDVLAGATVVADLAVPRLGSVRQVFTGPSGCYRDRRTTSWPARTPGGDGPVAGLVLEPLQADRVGAWAASLAGGDGMRERAAEVCRDPTATVGDHGVAEGIGPVPRVGAGIPGSRDGTMAP